MRFVQDRRGLIAAVDAEQHLAQREERHRVDEKRIGAGSDRHRLARRLLGDFRITAVRQDLGAHRPQQRL